MQVKIVVKELNIIVERGKLDGLSAKLCLIKLRKLISIGDIQIDSIEQPSAESKEAVINVSIVRH
jgi:hypothetical protein